MKKITATTKVIKKTTANKKTTAATKAKVVQKAPVTKKPVECRTACGCVATAMKKPVASTKATAVQKPVASNTSQPAKMSPPPVAPGIEFTITLPTAGTVAVAGTFNGWDPTRTPLRNEGGGVWRVVLPLTPGRYEYRYVVDGQWQQDPAAKEVSTNPFGEHNSVVTVAGGPRRAVPTTMVA